MKYVAYLRGINVSGHKIIKMKELADVFAKAGYENVKTYIQTGNIIFEANRKSNRTLESEINKLIIKAFKHDVEVMVRTEKEIGEVIASAPFKKNSPRRTDPGKKLYVTFLKEKLSPQNSKLLKSLSSPQETFYTNGKEIYTTRDPKLQFDKTVLGKFDQKLKVPTTTRNWNVVNKIYELMQ